MSDPGLRQLGEDFNASADKLQATLQQKRFDSTVVSRAEYQNVLQLQLLLEQQAVQLLQERNRTAERK